MRKIFLAIMIICTMSLCACGIKKDSGKKPLNESNENSEITLEQYAIEGIDGIMEFAQNEDLITSFISVTEVTDTITAWGNAKASLSDRKEIIISDKDIDSIIKNTIGANDYSKELRNYLKNRFFAGFAGNINSEMGTEILAASSIANYYKSYIMNENMDDQIWIVPTNVDGVAYAITFTNTGDKVITVTTTYISYDEKKSFDDFADSIKFY